LKVGGNDNLIEEGESAIVELCLNTLEDLFLEGKVKEVEDDSLILAKELTTMQRHELDYN
jgi:hypothetical protein